MKALETMLNGLSESVLDKPMILVPEEEQGAARAVRDWLVEQGMAQGSCPPF